MSVTPMSPSSPCKRKGDVSPLLGPVRPRLRREPWRGVNFGGWLLLEPGPAQPLFKHVPEARCEWELMRGLRAADALGALQEHRETFITKADFKKVKQMGLNCVRLPIGYWVVMGPCRGSPYVGPCLEFVDRALDWAEECGLQVLLDLHGCPGGESPDAPCGRRQRPASNWNWRHWNFGLSVDVLRELAQRYKHRRCITGIQVCNEPSREVPAGPMCRFYERAISVIRENGMDASRVAIVCPVFQRDVEEIAGEMNFLKGPAYNNVCFDMHYYHCFGDDWNGLTFAQQLRAVEKQKQELKKYPAVVGEWSLALGRASNSTAVSLDDADQVSEFAAAQMAAYQHASHGWFFWNWSDGNGASWDWQQAAQLGWLSRVPRKLPRWSGVGRDPLEEVLNPSPVEPEVCIGDAVFLRTSSGFYVDVERTNVRARWSEKGLWQKFTIIGHRSGKRRGVLASVTKRRAIRSGDRIRLQTHGGRVLATTRDLRLVASRQRRCHTAEFEVHVQEKSDDVLRHRAGIFLKSKSAEYYIGMDDGDRDDQHLHALWPKKGGFYQQFVVEKAAAQQCHI